MIKNKRGMELPQSVVIIAIIVLVVLVVVLAFFAGGFGQIGSRLSSLFSGGVDDQATAVNFCNSYCDSVKGFGDNLQAVRGSAFCNKWFKLDTDNDGKADKDSSGVLTRYYCSYDNHNTDQKYTGTAKGIGVDCPDLQAGACK